MEARMDRRTTKSGLKPYDPENNGDFQVQGLNCHSGEWSTYYHRNTDAKAIRLAKVGNSRAFWTIERWRVIDRRTGEQVWPEEETDG
jgi:hypothetical protein